MTTQITDVNELAEGDEVTVTGNGVDETREVVQVFEDDWKGRTTARLAGGDFAYRLANKNEHPLQSNDKMHLNGVGTVTVERA